MEKIKILGASIHNVDMKEAKELVASFIFEKRSAHVITLNAEILNRATDEPELLTTINNAQLVTPDGTGVIWAAGKIGTPLKERVAGIDLMMELVAEAEKRDWKIYLYGAKPEILKKAVENLQEKYPKLNIIGYTDGYIKAEEQGKLIEDIQTKEPDLVFVAMGAPRQEYWIRDNLPKLPPCVAIGVGGSLDVISGELKRAPLLIQKLRLEWLYRSLIQPSRFNRLIFLPQFVLKILRNR